MPSVTRRWRKWAACSCTHGADIDPNFRRAFLAFLADYKPDQRLHLGDAIDLACLRSGARRDPDEPDRAESLMDDLLAGLSFLHEMRPTVYLDGNHEARAVQLSRSGNQVVAYAAGQVIQRMRDELARYKTKHLPWLGMQRGGIHMLGGTAFLHGALYNVSAARDTAEALGMDCVFGHTHRVAMESSRTLNPVIGYNIGCGISLGAEYAASRRQTLGWRHAFAYGEFTDDACTVNVHILSPHYRLP
jgi:predicted phosphodiesterase